MNSIRDYNDSRTVAANMQKSGGCFVKHLGHALECADYENIQRIKTGFKKYWDDYLKMEK